jgi:hypothetical protein
LLKNPKVIDSIKKLFEILEWHTACDVFEKSIAVQKIIKVENITKGLFAASKCMDSK